MQLSKGLSCSIRACFYLTRSIASHRSSHSLTQTVQFQPAPLMHWPPSSLVVRMPDSISQYYADQIVSDQSKSGDSKGNSPSVYALGDAARGRIILVQSSTGKVVECIGSGVVGGSNGRIEGAFDLCTLGRPVALAWKKKNEPRKQESSSAFTASPGMGDSPQNLYVLDAAHRSIREIDLEKRSVSTVYRVEHRPTDRQNPSDLVVSFNALEKIICLMFPRFRKIHPTRSYETALEDSQSLLQLRLVHAHQTDESAKQELLKQLPSEWQSIFTQADCQSCTSSTFSSSSSIESDGDVLINNKIIPPKEGLHMLGISPATTNQDAILKGTQIDFDPTVLDNIDVEEIKLPLMHLRPGPHEILLKVQLNLQNVNNKSVALACPPTLVFSLDGSGVDLSFLQNFELVKTRMSAMQADMLGFRQTWSPKEYEPLTTIQSLIKDASKDANNSASIFLECNAGTILVKGKIGLYFKGHIENQIIQTQVISFELPIRVGLNLGEKHSPSITFTLQDQA